uniref:Neurexin-3b-like n=1 Tax=Sinocyclocheilus anshuiensis TaxID=1608454 RepID=A0A671L3A6_9TELE
MRPHFETRYSLWLARMLPLAIGCMFSTAWGSNPDNTVVLSSSTFSHSETQHQHHPAGARHHPPPVAIYRSPAPLRGGHAGATYIFGKGGGLITYTWPNNERPSTRTDRLAVGFSSTIKDGILVRIDSAPRLGDYIMLHIVSVQSSIMFYSFDSWQSGHYTIDVHNMLPINDNINQLLTIFNTQATISIGGNDRKRPYQGQLSGLYYNGLKVLNMAAEGHANIKINGSVRLVGDVPTSRSPPRTTTSMPPEMSTTFIETTTTLSTTTTRKQRSPPTIQTTDDIVSSAECSSDDEDLEECDGGHTGGELVIPVLVEDPIDIPPVSTRAPFIPLPPTLHPVLTIIETTKESLSIATEAGVPCLSDQGSDDCDDDDDDGDDGDGLVISGFGSGEAFDSSLPPTDDEDFYTTFSLVTDKILTTSTYEGGYKALAPKWEVKDFKPSKASEAGRTTAIPPLPDFRSSAASPVTSETAPKIPAGKMNNREIKPQPDIVLLPLPTSFDMDGTKPRGPYITQPMLRTIPSALTTVPGIRRVPPGASEVIRESSSTTGMVVGIVTAAALCILILLYAMYKYRNRDEGSYQVDETRNYISNAAQNNGTVVKDKQPSTKGASNKRPKDKDKEYYV